MGLAQPGQFCLGSLHPMPLNRGACCGARGTPSATTTQNRAQWFSHYERERRLWRREFPDVEGEWTVWGLVLNPLVEIHYILQDTLLSLKWK